MDDESRGNGPANDLARRVRAGLISLLRVEPGRVRPEARLLEDLNVDSLEFLTIVNGLERDFDVLVPDKEATRLRTVGQTVELVCRLVEAGKTEGETAWDAA